MMAFLILFLHVLVSPFETRARLEAEIVLLRHQLNVLRRRVPSKPKLAVAFQYMAALAHTAVVVVIGFRHRSAAL